MNKLSNRTVRSVLSYAIAQTMYKSGAPYLDEDHSRPVKPESRWKQERRNKAEVKRLSRGVFDTRRR